MRLKAIVLLIPFLFVAACGGLAPELPPADSMVLPDFFEDRSNSNALTAAESTTTNIRLAAGSVVLVTGVLHLALLMPRAMFIEVIKTKANKEGDEWIWSRNFPILGVEAALHGSLNDKLELEMHVTGKRESIDLDDFIWYTGEHDPSRGIWTMYAPAEQSDVLTIKWERQGPTDKALVFTNTTTGKPHSGDSITYALDGTNASMTITDLKDAEGLSRTFEVEWDTDDGSGKLTNKDGDTFCWDTLGNGQVDIPCP